MYPDTYFGAASFAHQAAEKALKAAHWHLRAEEPPWKHDLLVCAARVGEYAGGVPLEVQAAVAHLQPVFEESRYPFGDVGKPIPADLITGCVEGLRCGLVSSLLRCLHDWSPRDAAAVPLHRDMGGGDVGKKSRKKGGKRASGVGKSAGHAGSPSSVQGPSHLLAGWGIGESSSGPQPPSDRVMFPSAQTIFRYSVLNSEVRELLEATRMALRPKLEARDGDRVRRIREARTPEALLDLLPIADGLGELAWNQRMRALGSEVLPLIVERLKGARGIRDSGDREKAVEKLIADLRWRGQGGADALLESLDSLDDYGKSQAFVALGLLGARAAADRMWDFYQKMVGNRRKNYFVGALWGLVDLKDERAVDALVDLLGQERVFYELFGFFWLVGDRRAIAPLLIAAVKMGPSENLEPLMALLGVAHRLGRDALVAEFTRGLPPDVSSGPAVAKAEELLRIPAGRAEEYFASFRRGPTREEMENALRGVPGAGLG